ESIKENITKEECEEIKTYAYEKGIGLKTMASGFYWGCSIASPDAEERKKAIDFSKKYIKATSNLGAETILLIPGAVDVAWDESRPVVPYQEVWDNATESLKELVPIAEEAGVNIGLENVWNKFLLSPMEMKLFIEQFNSKHIGCYLDLGNTLANGYPEHWITLLGEHVKAIHVKNFERTDCGGVLHGFGDSLKEGDLDYEQVIVALKSINYQGPLTVEMIPFSRLPDLVLPDMELAHKVAKELLEVI
ncbi:MAG: sugar phosphate isomerase/epimerase, partial [Cyclobacteriaceae bacterium]|nr:sugar phosphate isomerase/epimerase [Cyclobacteriaceae bacterium]